MSKTIDQRVVEMQFNNKNFEKNVSQSMSTLDKLKEKLNFRGASKAMDELNHSMKGFDASPISNALSTVGDKFSLLEQVAIGALRKIGSQIVQTGEQLIKSLSTDNIAAGWAKYGDKTTSVATLVAQGYAMEEVNEQLERLNWFTDETSYNFVDMVGNIGKFTASGQKLEDAVTAMEGIANWAARSGQNAATASRAMYQLSQAMSKGALKFDDWKSIQNASMDTIEFRRQAAEAAVALGSLEKAGEDAYRVVYEGANGAREVSSEIVSLSDLFTSDFLTRKAWLDTDVMMAVFSNYGKATKTLKALVDDETNGIDLASEAIQELRDQAQELVDEANAAGKELTFDDALKQASLNMVGRLSDVKSEANDYIKSVQESENRTISFNEALVELGYSVDQFSLEALEAAQEARTWTDVIDSVKDAVSTGWMNTFENIFGDYEGAKKLWTRLANDFYDIFAEGGNERNNVLGIWNDYIEPGTRDLLDQAKQSDAIKQYGNVIKQVESVSGRDLLFSVDKNNPGAIISILETIKDLLAIIKDSWNEMFYGTTDADKIANQKADTLMAITNALKAFADAIKINSESADKLKRTFDGLFAIIGIIKDIIGTAFTSIWKGLSTLFGDVNVDILDLTAGIGDNLKAFRKWLKQSGVLETVFGGIGTAIANVITFVKNIFNYIQSIPWVTNAINAVKDALQGAGQVLKEFFERFASGEKISAIFKDLIERAKKLSPVVKFISDVWNKIKDFFSSIFEGFANAFSSGFTNISEFFSNLGSGISNAWTVITGAFANAGEGIGKVIDFIKEKFKEIDGGKILRILAIGAIYIAMFKLLSLFSSIKSVIESFTGAISKIGTSFDKAIKRISKAISKIGKSIAKYISAKALISISTAILMLVGAIAALYFMDEQKLYVSVGILAALIISLGALAAIAGKMKDLWKGALGLTAISVALLGLVFAVKLLNDIDGGWGAIGKTFVLVLIVGFVTALAVIAAQIMNEMDNTHLLDNLKKLTLFMLSLTGSILLLGVATKILSTVDGNDILKTIGLVGTLVASIALLTIVTSVFNKGSWYGLGSMLLKTGVALVLLAGAIKIFSILKPETFRDGAIRIGLVGLIFAALISVSAMAGKYSSEAGSMLLKISGAFAIMTGVIKLISLLDTGEIVKGLIVMTLFSALIGALIFVSQWAGENASKAGLMLLEISGSLLILSGVIWILSAIPVDGLAKATIAVSALMIIFGMLIYVSKFAQDVKSTIITLTVSAVLLSAAIAALSLLTNTNDTLKAAAAIGIVLGMFGLVIGMTSKVQKATGTIILLTAAIVAIGAVLWGMSALGTEADGAIKNAAAIAILFATMAIVISMVSRIKDVGKLIPMIGAILVLSLIMWLLNDVLIEMNGIDADSAIKNAAAIAILLGTMGLITLMLSKFASGAGGIAGMLVGVGALAILSLVLTLINDVIIEMSGIDADSAIKNATAIAILLGAMGGVLIALGLLGALSITTGVGAIGAAGGMLVGVGAMALLALVMTLINDVIIEMQNMDANSAISYADAIARLMLAMVNVLVQLSLIGPLALLSLIGLGVLSIVVLSILELCKNLATLSAEVPQLQSFIDTAIPILENIGTALGNFFGNIVGGFIKSVGTKVLDLIPIFGTKLSNFASNVSPFIRYIRGIDSGVFDNMKILVESLVLLTAADVISGLGSFVSKFSGGGGGLEEFASNLETVGEGMAKFSKKVEGQIDKQSVEDAVSALADLVRIEASMDIMAKIGKTGLGLFSENLGTVGLGLSSFSLWVAGKIDTESNEKAINTLSDLVKIESSMGFFEKLGITGLGSFSTNLGTIGAGISAFSNAVKGKIYKKANEDAITALADLVAIGQSLDILDVIGGYTLSAFSMNLGYIASGIVKFSDTVKDQIANEDVTNAIAALGDLVNIGNNISVLSVINGFALGSFSGNLENIAKGIVNFSTTVLGNIDRQSNDDALNVIERLSSLATGGSNGTLGALIDKLLSYKELELFATNLPVIARGIAGFSTEVKGKMYTKSNSDALAFMTDFINFMKESSSGNPFEFISRVMALGEIGMFAISLPIIGKGIGGFAENVTGSISNITSINSAISILKQFSSVNEKTGGLSTLDFIEKLNSIKSLQVFATNLPYIGFGIAAMLSSISSIKDTDALQFATDALGKIPELNELIDNVVDDEKIVTLTTRLESYNVQLKELARIFADFALTSREFGPESIDEIQEIIDKLSTLGKKKVEISRTPVSYNAGFDASIDTSTINTDDLLNNPQDYIDQIIGDVSSAADGADYWQLTDVLQNGLGGALGNIDIGSITSSFDTESLMTGLTDKIGGIFGSNGDETGGLTGALQTGFEGSIGNLNLDSIISNFDADSLMGGLKDKIGGVFGSGEGGTGGFDWNSLFGDSLNGFKADDLAQQISDKTGLAISDEDNLESISTAGGEIFEKMASGFEDKSNSELDGVKPLARDVITGLTTALENMAPKLKECGGKIAKSLTSGIELTLQIHSPSKVMYGLGEYAGQGFVNALGEYASISSDAGNEVGSSAIDGIKNAILNSSYKFDTSIDAEPTITPVVDLSNVRASASEINGIMSSNANLTARMAETASFSFRNPNINDNADSVQKIDDRNIVDEISKLQNNITDLVDKVSKLQVVMDSGALVGELISPIDQELGIRAVRSRRERG